MINKIKNWWYSFVKKHIIDHDPNEKDYEVRK